jgi:hypothetical protein
MFWLFAHDFPMKLSVPRVFTWFSHDLTTEVAPGHTCHAGWCHVRVCGAGGTHRARGEGGKRMEVMTIGKSYNKNAMEHEGFTWFNGSQCFCENHLVRNIWPLFNHPDLGSQCGITLLCSELITHAMVVMVCTWDVPSGNLQFAMENEPFSSMIYLSSWWFSTYFLSPKVCLWENGKQYRQPSYFIEHNPLNPIHPHHIINKPSISSIIPIYSTYWNSYDWFKSHSEFLCFPHV